MEKLIITPTGRDKITYAYEYQVMLTFNEIKFSDLEQPETLDGDLYGNKVTGVLVLGYKATYGNYPNFIIIGYIDRTYYPSVNYIPRSCAIYSGGDNICFCNLKYNNRETSVLVKLNLILETFPLDVLNWLKANGVYGGFDVNTRIRNYYQGKTSLVPPANRPYVHYTINNMKIVNEVRMVMNNTNFRLVYDSVENKLFLEEIT